MGLVHKRQQTIIDPKTPLFADHSGINVTQRDKPCDTFIAIGGYNMSPMSRLPLELRTEIFYACLPCHKFPRFKSTEAPWILVQVCNDWRALALSIPTLWSSFEFDIQQNGNPYRMMERWIYWSKQRPLSVKIHMEDDFQDDVAKCTNPEELLTILVAQAIRWRHIHLILPIAHLIPFFVYASETPRFPLLESLTFNVQSKTMSPDLSVMICDSIGFSLGQLTELHLYLPHGSLLTLDQCLNLLKEGIRLRCCSMNADCIIKNRRSIPQRIVLPTLEYFHLALQGGAKPTGISRKTSEWFLINALDTLIMPKLKNLHFEWLVRWDSGNRSWSESHSTFSTFMARMTDSLQRITLNYLPLNEAQVMECLRHFPFLTSLDLRFSLVDKENDPITDNFFRALTAPLPKQTHLPRLLPHLNSIRLQCSGKACSDLSIIAFVHSRWRLRELAAAGWGLRLFHFFSSRPATGILEECTRRWNSEGLEVTVDSVVFR